MIKLMIDDDGPLPWSARAARRSSAPSLASLGSAPPASATKISFGLLRRRLGLVIEVGGQLEPALITIIGYILLGLERVWNLNQHWASSPCSVNCFLM